MATHAYYIQAADAQARLPNNSVRSETIVNGQVQTADLANNAVTSSKILDGTIQAGDIASGVIPDGGGAIQLTEHIVQSAPVELSPGESDSANADCPDGDFRTGGGFAISGDIQIKQSLPGVGENSWEAFGTNRDSSFGGVLNAYAICLDATIS
jgi:hypothetical protein